MLIEFDKMQEVTIAYLNAGNGAVSAKMFIQPECKMTISHIPAGASIGLHEHTTSSEINYVLDGNGKAVCDGKEEMLQAGVCQYCPKGSSHTIFNTGMADLVLFTVVTEQ